MTKPAVHLFQLPFLTLATAMFCCAVQAQPVVDPAAEPKAQPKAQPEGVADTGKVTFLDGTLTTTGTLTSDYVFRGFSQNDEKISPLLSATWAHKSGVHADLFAAPVDFNLSDDASLEIDTTIGYTHAFTDALSGDVSVVGYWYPGADGQRDYDYVEGIGTVSYAWDVAKTTGLVAYSPEYYGHVGQSVFTEGAVEVPLTGLTGVNGVTAVAAFGHQNIEQATDYNTWRTGVNYTLKGFVFGVTYYDTDLSDYTCSDLCGSRMVLSASKSF